MKKKVLQNKLDRMKKHLEKAFWLAKDLNLDQTPSHIKCCMDDIKADGEFNAKSVLEFQEGK